MSLSSATKLAATSIDLELYKYVGVSHRQCSIHHNPYHCISLFLSAYTRFLVDIIFTNTILSSQIKLFNLSLLRGQPSLTSPLIFFTMSVSEKAQMQSSASTIYKASELNYEPTRNSIPPQYTATTYTEPTYSTTAYNIVNTLEKPIVIPRPSPYFPIPLPITD